MSKWPGKYVIGLTGNIATGKSVVRRMLEHLGAYGIDADALSHRAIARGAPGYRPVLEMFGRFVLGDDGQINRARLGRVVFSDPEALAALEAIVHPLVEQAVDLIIRRSTQTVVVIEAIKLIESGLRQGLDSIWVSYAPPMIQMARLMDNRKMSEAEARQRLMAQPPQEQKIAQANVVIKNTSSFEDTWRQVTAAWQKTVPVAVEQTPIPTKAVAHGELSVARGRPRDSSEIAGLLSRLHSNGQAVTEADVMAAFGEKAFMLLKQDDHLVGVIGWQVENLVARTIDVYIDPAVSAGQAIPALMNAMEKASRDLQCEASLLFLTGKLARQEAIWKNLGYEPRTPETLGVQAWQEAAVESMPPRTQLFFKQLRRDRILRPI